MLYLSTLSMLKTANENKVTNTFLNDKMLRGLTGFKNLRFIEGGIHNDTVHVKARISRLYAICPVCDKKSHSVHSTYERHVMDLPIHRKRMNITLIETLHKRTLELINASNRLIEIKMIASMTG